MARAEPESTSFNDVGWLSGAHIYKI